MLVVMTAETHQIWHFASSVGKRVSGPRFTLVDLLCQALIYGSELPD